MRVANDVLATFPGHAVKRGLPHQCAVGLGPQGASLRLPARRHALASFFAMFRDERARGLAVKLRLAGSTSLKLRPYLWYNHTAWLMISGGKRCRR